MAVFRLKKFLDSQPQLCGKPFHRDLVQAVKEDKDFPLCKPFIEMAFEIFLFRESKMNGLGDGHIKEQFF